MKNYPVIAQKVFKKYQKRSLVSPWLPQMEKKGTSSREFYALNDISFSVNQGEAFGVIGKNGSGKTTLLKLLAGISQPTKGKVQVNGTKAPLIGVGVGFHQEMTGRENIFINGVLLGMKPRVISRQLSKIVEFAELQDFLDVPLKYYSSGMKVRLGFATVIHAQPDVLLVDEVLSVGDAAFQRKCLDSIRKVKDSGTTIVFVSHNIFLVESLCERALLLSKGKVVIKGDSLKVSSAYTNLLIKENISDRQKSINKDSKDVQDQKVLVYENRSKKNNFKFGQDLSVKFTMKLLKTVKKPGISFSIIRQDGELCGSNRWTMTKKTLKGPVSYQFRIKNPRLVPQAYRLHVLVWDHDFLGSVAQAISQQFIVKTQGINVNQDWGIFVPQISHASLKTTS